MFKARRRSCNTTNAARFLVLGLVLATASCVLARDDIDDEPTAADIVVDAPIPTPASVAAEVVGESKWYVLYMKLIAVAAHCKGHF
jgi:hypothetical protein